VRKLYNCIWPASQEKLYPAQMQINQTFRKRHGTA
jgi:hypothetical protein